tara:strand:- start:353 stop:628 length:276 start_codon:yes stop_codon:yes gene_type:complete
MEIRIVAASPNFVQYQNGETFLKRDGTGYLVEHGIGSRPPLKFKAKSLDKALVRFFHWRHRRCTSCGQPGCAEDLVGKRGLIVEPLPAPQG